MKYILIVLSIIFYTFNINAQDTILLKNGKIISCSIIEKTNYKIKCQSTQITNRDTIIDLKLSKVKTIDYCSKSRDVLIQQSPRNIYPLGVNVGVDFFLFKLLFNGSIDYLITPKLSAEINYRSMLSESYPAFSLFSIGGKYWFANKYSKSEFSPFVGLFFTQWRSKNDIDDILWLNKPIWDIIYLPEVPIGISYISKSGLQTSFQMSLPLFCAEFRLGWRFKTSKKGNY